MTRLKIIMCGHTRNLKLVTTMTRWVYSNNFVMRKKLFDFKIVDVNLTSEGRTKLQLGESLAFSYEVIWKKQSTLFEVIIVDQIF